MTATALVQQISRAQKDAWPEVLRALDQTTRSTAELAGISEDAIHEIETYAATHDAPRKRRRICEETVWALARLGWLRTGGERDLALAAIAWEAVPPNADDEQLAQVEDDLIKAIEALPDYQKEN